MSLLRVFQSLLLATTASGSLDFPLLPRQANSTNSTSEYAVKTPPLTTPWTYQVGTNPWPQYPRPRLERAAWQTLNGVWRYQNASVPQAIDSPPFNQTLQNPVLIPSCLESGLSGVQGTFNIYSWFSTSFTIPSNWTAGNRVLLNFGAVDYQATVFVNGQRVGQHTGGYFAFTFDVTNYLSASGGSNELLVFVFDPTDSNPYVIPIGKQTLTQSHIFYTPCSGIWQSVWIESAPSNFITDLNLNADMHGNVFGAITTSQNLSTSAEIAITPRNSSGHQFKHQVYANQNFSFNYPSPQLWSPDTPNLYDISITLGNDTVSSYTGFRTISRGVVNGIQRPLLNGEFKFFFGTLDQGYWPDGIYTPPNMEAMRFDLLTLKKLGYNTLRKHMKIESDLYYQACDELGLLVIQDMPAMKPLHYFTTPNCTAEPVLPNATQQVEFNRQLEMSIRQHRNYPCIFTWTIYNEGWGQATQPPWPSIHLTDVVRALDPTRLVDATSGWFNHGAGDYIDNHHYSEAQCGAPVYSINSAPYDPDYIGIQGEFGGIGLNASIQNLWPLWEAVKTINQTYEINLSLDSWRYRGHSLIQDLQHQIEAYACSGAIWTQTTDVEGEVNGMLTYDRRVLRPDVQTWNSDVNACYAAGAARTNSSMSMMGSRVMD